MSENDRLLIVDDNALNREILKRCLEVQGFRAGEAGSGQAALESIQDKSWDLVLLDVMMPEMDGIEVLKEIRESKSLTELPVIMVSARGDSEMIGEALECGANDYVSRPLNFPVVFSRIRAQLRLKKAVEQVEELSSKRLEDERARLSAVINQTRMGIINFDPSGTVISFNPGALKVFSTTPEQVIGKAIHDYIPKFFLESSSHSTSKPKAIDIQRVQGLSQSGQKIWLEVSVSELALSNDQSWIAIVKDISDEVEVKEELKRVNSNLEQQIEDRTRELKEALHLAETSNKSKSDFVSMMSHEIRTPLNAIIGMSQLALNSNLNNRQNHYITQSHKAALSLLDLLDDILDFSKIESDKLELESIEFDLDSVLSNLAASTSYSAQVKGLEYLYDIDPLTSGTFLGDPTRLGQILTNFVGNAIKFTEQGEVLVKTKFIEEIEGQYWIEVTVSDTGIGMSKEQQARLFKPFSQADMSVTRLFGGTGLGLAISKKLLELMNGEPQVESELGKGTSFSFRLPLQLVRKKAVRESLPQVLKQRALRVLIVDQGEASRQILNRIIEHIGFEAEQCESGLRAFEECRKAQDKNEPYDVVLMNWKLPLLDGIDTAKLFSKDEILKDLKVCMMVPTNNLEEFQAKKESLDLASLLAKPFNISSIWDALVEAVTESQKIEKPIGTKLIKSFHELHHRRVLLVEDHKINQELALDFLKLAHMEVLIANDGVEALEILAEQSFDIILMDLHMPRMDGFTATRKIRQDLKLNIPVIAMTAAVGTMNRKEAMRAGVDDYIAKPFRAHDLYETLQKWVRLQPQSVKPKPEPEDPLGLDRERGLYYFSGDEQRYLRYLKLFLDNFTNYESEFLGNIESQEWEAAYLQTHSLKGLAGTIGATRLENLALKLEKILKDKEARAAWRAHFAPALSELKNVLSTISELTSSEA